MPALIELPKFLLLQGARDLREAANSQNLQAFVESINVLEDGLQNLKNMYEKELADSRYDCNR